MSFQGKRACRAVVIAAVVFGDLLPTGADGLIHPFNDPAFNFTVGATNSDYVAEWTQIQDPNNKFEVKASANWISGGDATFQDGRTVQNGNGILKIDAAGDTVKKVTLETTFWSPGATAPGISLSDNPGDDLWAVIPTWWNGPVEAGGQPVSGIASHPVGIGSGGAGDDGLGTPIDQARYELRKANFGSSSSYPPILVTINVHGHNYGFPKHATILDSWETLKQDRYDSDKEQILWIADLAESVGAQVNYQLNGEYCRDARLLNGDDTAHLVALEDQGHVMGSHFHMYRFSGENEFWESVSTPTASQADLEKIWDDQIGECEQTLGHSLFRIDPAIMSSLVDSDAIVEELTEAYQPQIEPGAETFSYTDWNQKPWNPFHRMRGTSLTEDPNRDILAGASIGQVGQLVPAGKHQIMASVSQIQRQFLALVAEWRENERLGLTPKVWQFGIMTHPHQTITYQDEMQDVVEWFATWTEQATEQGNVIAEFATDAKVVERFEQWEESYPGESSFDYDWEAYLAGNPEPYPYLLEGVSLGLKDAELDEQLTGWQAEGVTVFRLYKREVVRGPADGEGLRSMDVRNLYEEPLYLLWSTTGESVEIDFSAEQSGALYQVNSKTGGVTTVDAVSLTVPPTAMVVSAVEDVSQTPASPSAMLALHLDPNNSVGEVENATPEHWGRLKAFVAAADLYGHKLTLLMSSSWVDLVDGTLDGVNRIDQLKSWIEKGHQLGYHHHSCGHNHPDGYRDVIGKTCKGEEDRGSVQDSFGEVYALGEALISMGVDPGLARVEIAAQGPNAYNEYRSEEWQAEAIYATSSVDDNPDAHTGHKFITLPRCTENYGNNYGTSTATYEVSELGHAQLDVGEFVDLQDNNNLAQLEVEIDQVLTGDHADSGVHIGVVFHPREYHKNPRATDRDSYANDKKYLNAILQLFAHKGLPVVTAREILQAANPCINSSVPGDFNGDQTVDDADIDLLFTAITTGSEDLQFDLDSSDTVTSSDATFLVESILGTRFGDTELDRDVDITDFNALASHFDPAGDGDPQNGPFWNEGNFDGDDDIDITDFNVLASNFMPDGYGTAAIPEPTSLLLASLTVVLVSVSYRPSKNSCCNHV